METASQTDEVHSNSSEHPFAAKASLVGWVVASVRFSIGAAAAAAVVNAAFPVLDERPRYTTVAVATGSSRARRECPYDVLTVLRSGRLHGAGADCGHDDLRDFLGVGDHDNV